MCIYTYTHSSSNVHIHVHVHTLMYSRYMYFVLMCVGKCEMEWAGLTFLGLHSIDLREGLVQGKYCLYS